MCRGRRRDHPAAGPPYNPATGWPRTYRVDYKPGKLGNLVHELTHVMVNANYRRDFANHAAAQPASMPAPMYNALGVRENELDRQLAGFRAWPMAAMESALAELLELSTLLQALDAGSELGKHKRQVANQPQYGAANVNTEHDTVLNQILIWIHVDWQLTSAADAKAFVDKLESACSRERRRAARRTQPEA